MSKYNAEIIDIKEVDKHLRIFKIKPDKAFKPFEAGQYTTLGLDGFSERLAGAQIENLPEEKKKRIQKRAYSICSPIFDDHYRIVNHNKLDYYEFYISLMLNGDKNHPPFLTPRLFMLEVGDRIEIGNKIVGHYQIGNINKFDNIIFISTGTGQAPHNVMLSELLRDGHEGKIAIIECNRYSSNFAYAEQLEEISESYRNVFYEKIITSEMPNYYVQNLFGESLLEKKYNFNIKSSNTHVYLCGNPTMIGAPKVSSGVETFSNSGGMVAFLQMKYGLRTKHSGCDGQINFEKYW